MRIFFAVPRSAWVDLNLRRSLEAMGHQIIPFSFPGWPEDDDPAWRSSGKPRTNEEMLASFRRALDEGPIDLFYGYLYSSVVYPETLQEIGRSGVPMVNFTCNNVHQFELVEQIAPYFDVSIVPEKAAVEKFRRVGARPLRIQLAANPEVYRPYPEPRVWDVTFVGQRYADRADFLCHLHRNGVQVRAWGAGWQPQKRLSSDMARAAASLIEDEGWQGFLRVGRRLVSRVAGEAPRAAAPAPPNASSERLVDGGATDDEVMAFGGPRLLHRDLVRTFSRSHLSLGFATAGESHLASERLTHLRLREFEAPMSGALYLAEYQEELEEYFRPGEEMLCYHDANELLDTVRYYLSRPEQAERVRQAGRRRAIQEHTWQRRFAELFVGLGLR